MTPNAQRTAPNSASPKGNFTASASRHSTFVPASLLRP
jgi:hypothetical protein